VSIILLFSIKKARLLTFNDDTLRQIYKPRLLTQPSLKSEPFRRRGRSRDPGRPPAPALTRLTTEDAIRGQTWTLAFHAERQPLRSTTAPAPMRSSPTSSTRRSMRGGRAPFGVDRRASFFDVGRAVLPRSAAGAGCREDTSAFGSRRRHRLAAAPSDPGRRAMGDA